MKHSRVLCVWSFRSQLSSFQLSSCKQSADVLNYLHILLPFSCYLQRVGSQSVNPLCQQKLIHLLILMPNHLQLRPICEKHRTCNFFLLFLAILCLSMANPAEEYQVEISEIFNNFLDLMQTSSARVDIESQRFQGYCQVKLSL